VSSGGIASGTVVSNGGNEYVRAGGFDWLSVISSGGLEFISSAGTISGGTVISGGTINELSGGKALGGLTISGGTAVISGTMASGQAVKFAGLGGDLALFNLPHFAAVISGFGTGDQIDLGGFAFSNGETRTFAEAANHQSGTLTVVDGSNTARVVLAGRYVTSNFTLQNDGAGGTFAKFT
jgi:hypothetical protein